jgi:hypothetical protein
MQQYTHATSQTVLRPLHGARVSTNFRSRGVPLSFTPLFLPLKRCHACDQCHSSRFVTLVLVDAVNCFQTLKDTLCPPWLLTMNPTTTLMASHKLKDKWSALVAHRKDHESQDLTCPTCKKVFSEHRFLQGKVRVFDRNSGCH